MLTSPYSIYVNKPPLPIAFLIEVIGKHRHYPHVQPRIGGADATTRIVITDGETLSSSLSIPRFGRLSQPKSHSSLSNGPPYFS